jgi:hypothetical protein
MTDWVERIFITIAGLAMIVFLVMMAGMAVGIWRSALQ